MDREHPPKNPFKPRPGAVPPFLAGRDEELQAVEANILRPLRDGKETSSNAALVSPRGFGKMALAETLRISAERQGRESPLLMMVDEVHTLDLEVARTLLNAVQSTQKRGAPLRLLVAGTPDLPHHLQVPRPHLGPLGTRHADGAAPAQR